MTPNLEVVGSNLAFFIFLQLSFYSEVSFIKFLSVKGKLNICWKILVIERVIAETHSHPYLPSFLTAQQQIFTHTYFHETYVQFALR